MYLVMASRIVMADLHLNPDLGKPNSPVFSNSTKTVSLASLSFYHSHLTGLLPLLCFSFSSKLKHSTHCLHFVSSTPKYVYMHVSVHMWIYMYMCVHMLIHMCVHVWVYRTEGICMCEHACTYCVSVCMCMNICVYGYCECVCMWVCVYLHMYVRLCMFLLLDWKHFEGRDCHAHSCTSCI